MATGIVSVSLAIKGQTAVSRTLLGIAIAAWAGLAGALCWRIASDNERLRAEARSPAALAAVAGTAVLGSRFLVLGWPGPAAALLVVAAALWMAMIAFVLRGLPRPGTGATFMITVATESIAVLAAALAAPDHAPFLEYLAVLLAAAGMILYPVALSSFRVQELFSGGGDHWISGGALAISGLAWAQITLTAARLHVLGGGGVVLQDLTLAVWATAVAWLPALVAAELWRPRLGYDTRRWSTVFPLGMYAVCSYAAGAAAAIGGIGDFASAWTWIALAVWLATTLGFLRRLLLRTRVRDAPAHATTPPTR